MQDGVKRGLDGLGWFVMSLASLACSEVFRNFELTRTFCVASNTTQIQSKLRSHTCVTQSLGSSVMALQALQHTTLCTSDTHRLGALC